ncbi:high-affinity nitrate transporter-activating protein 2.1-like [Typha angustifolia]|uniref:high-affinity nitrate transporter-activating protein 2.1-like n=1 Tax=Typha angustifolia TaxID=59011 RepID=UPI003C2CF856
MAAGLRSSMAATVLLLLACYVGPSMGVLLSKLPQNLTVTYSPKYVEGEVLYAGEDKITVTWALKKTVPSGADAGYKKVEISLCFGPVSQVDRGWRKTNDDLKKDKTCQFTILEQSYAAGEGTYEYTIARDVPTATYFIRAYALDDNDVKLAYGQTTDDKKTTDLFDIKGITGRPVSLDISAACFSAFSVVALAYFFVVEKRKAKK